ncbi:MAG: radical SAM protein [bacterium]
MYEFSQFKFLHHLDRIRAICHGELPPPVTIEVDLTNACNHRCLWCLDHSYNSRIDTTLKETPFLNFADEIVEQGVYSLIFKGRGEPLLYYSFTKVIQHIRSKGLDLGLVTNGETINRHLEAIPHLSWVGVSLDAATAETHQKLHKPFKTDAFHTIVDNLYQISTSAYTGILYLIHPENIQEMEAAAQLARDVGCRCITFKRIAGEETEKLTSGMLREIDESIMKIKREQGGANFQVLDTGLYHAYRGGKISPYNICLAHHLIGILGSDGNLYPCMALRGEIDYSFGSIYRDTFRDIWYGERRKVVLKKISLHECSSRCLGQTSFFRYDYYNQLLEYLTTAKEKVGHLYFL